MSEANITAAIVHVRGQQLVAGRTKLLIPTICTVKWRSSPRSNRATGLFKRVQLKQIVGQSPC